MIICIIGKSCSGKTTLTNNLVAKYGLKKIVTSTSRPRRKGEIDKIDYNFYDYETMKKDIEVGKYIEWAEFNGWLYGTKLADIDVEDDSIIVLNPEGYKKIKTMFKNKVLGIYLKPSFIVRLKRILKRDSGNYGEAIRRYWTDYKDFRNLEADIVIKEINI